MSQTQGTKAQGRPWHLWVIGIVGFLWSSIGVFGLVATQTKFEPVMGRYPAEQVEYFYNFPQWSVGFWAIGVFGGVFGCLLLLLRNRLAVGVLLASTIGAIVSNGYGMLFAGGMEVMGGPVSLVFPTVIVIIAALLTLYARAMCMKIMQGMFLVAATCTLPVEAQ